MTTLSPRSTRLLGVLGLTLGMLGVFMVSEQSNLVGSIMKRKSADLILEKRGELSPSGNEVIYIIDVTNNGPDAASGVRIFENLSPENLSLRQVTASDGSVRCTIPKKQRRLHCDIKEMPPGTQKNIVITYAVPGEMQVCDRVITGSEASGEYSGWKKMDPNPENNITGKAEVTISCADLQVSANIPGPLQAGVEARYYLSIGNSGQKQSGKVRLKHRMPPELELLETFTAGCESVVLEDGSAEISCPAMGNGEGRLDPGASEQMEFRYRTKDGVGCMRLQSITSAVLEAEPVLEKNPSDNEVITETEVVCEQ